MGNGDPKPFPFAKPWSAAGEALGQCEGTQSCNHKQVEGQSASTHPHGSAWSGSMLTSLHHQKRKPVSLCQQPCAC